MGTKHQTFWRAASMALAALAVITTLSSCVNARYWHRDRWERSHRTYLEQRHDEHRDGQMIITEPRPWSGR